MRSLAVHVVLASLLAAGSAAQENTGADRVSSKSLQHLKEGRAHARQGSYPRALGDLRIAVALAERTPGADLTLALALHNLAEVYRLNGERVNALQAYRRALRLYDELDHKPAMAIAQEQIGKLLADSEGKDAPARQQSDAVVSSTTTAATEERLEQIDQAVDRIRKRLRSTGGSQAPAGRSMAPSSIEISKSGGLALKPGQLGHAKAVKQQILRGWRYPNTARDKHQEGTVEAAFSILKNGEIERIEILKSSGFLTLDMESIRSIREAAPFSSISFPRGQHQMDLRLVFNYALPVPDTQRVKASPSPAPSSHR